MAEPEFERRTTVLEVTLQELIKHVATKEQLLEMEGRLKDKLNEYRFQLIWGVVLIIAAQVVIHNWH